MNYLKTKKFHLKAMLCCVLLVMGCSDGGSKYKKEFVTGCVQSGGSKSLCACAFDNLEKLYSVEQMTELTEALTSPAGYSPAVRLRAQKFIEDSMESALRCQK